MGFFDEYPYTNWHNVNLDWVLERVKEWGQMVEANDQAFKDLEEANASFKEYVTNYLQNLDIQAEIDDKLDRMFEEGTLTQYLQPYISPVVTTWLDANITEPVGVVIDSSLTVAGAAADSRETGLRINSIFTQNAKSILLSCLRKMLFTDVNSDMLYKNLQISLFSGDVFNKWSYSITEGDLLMDHASVDANQTDLIKYPSKISYRYPYETRRTFCLNYGLAPYYNYDKNGVSSERYPIPIPMTANKIKLTMQPAQYLYMMVVPYDDVHNYYLHDIAADRMTWQEMSSPVIRDIVREDNKQLFITLNAKYNEAGTSYPVNPANVKIEFLV